MADYSTHCVTFITLLYFRLSLHETLRDSLKISVNFPINLSEKYRKKKGNRFLPESRCSEFLQLNDFVNNADNFALIVEKVMIMEAKFRCRLLNAELEY